MVFLKGQVKRRYKGEYQNREGEIKTKIVYDVTDESGWTVRMTDFDCQGEPFHIDQEIMEPVTISTYVRNGGANYSLQLARKDNTRPGLEAF